LNFHLDRRHEALEKIDQAIIQAHGSLSQKEGYLTISRQKQEEYSQQQFYLSLTHEALNFLVRMYWQKSTYLESLLFFDNSLENYDFLLSFIQSKLGGINNNLFIESQSKRTMTFYKYQ
jgi:hypothetical protein